MGFILIYFIQTESDRFRLISAEFSGMFSRLRVIRRNNRQRGYYDPLLFDLKSNDSNVIECSEHVCVRVVRDSETVRVSQTAFE